MFGVIGWEVRIEPYLAITSSASFSLLILGPHWLLRTSLDLESRFPKKKDQSDDDSLLTQKGDHVLIITQDCPQKHIRVGKAIGNTDHQRLVQQPRVLSKKDQRPGIHNQTSFYHLSDQWSCKWWFAPRLALAVASLPISIGGEYLQRRSIMSRILTYTLGCLIS
jgi:hypothetical protein